MIYFGGRESCVELIGTHAELIAKEGTYASLVNTQRLSFE
jgi:ABC-type multidrug transport system fused ATPase/permease subunit